MALTIQQAQNRIETLISFLAPAMITFQTSIRNGFQANWGVDRYLQFLLTDPQIEAVTGIQGLSVDVYEAPAGHGWSVTMTVSAEGRFFYRTWDGAGPETKATGAWIETDSEGIPI